MIQHDELSYYEYWLTKKKWSAHWAIRLVTDYIKLRRSWEAYEDADEVVGSIYNDIKARMNAEDARCVYDGSWVMICDDEWTPKEIDMGKSNVIPGKFIEWINNKGYKIPYEFKAFIGVEEKVRVINEKLQYEIDKAVCQGIARTLWDEYPEMTIEHMQDHHAIQVYGSGKMCCADTTLRRWLGGADTRTVKRGRKRKT